MDKEVLAKKINMAKILQTLLEKRSETRTDMTTSAHRNINIDEERRQIIQAFYRRK